MRKLYILMLCSLFAGLMIPSNVAADWVTKDGYVDYCSHMVGVPPMEYLVDGMPDFDQKQDNWRNAANQWNWCGPVATANCLWWFDSKFETIKCKSLPPGMLVRPPAVSDHYSLVYNTVAGAQLDDHDPQNVVPWITLLGNALPGGIPPAGVTAQQIRAMILNWLASPQVNLTGHYTVTIVHAPSFRYIYEQVEISQDVILLLGFWQLEPTGAWGRFGGHWVTVAGVDTQEVDEISFSDPLIDVAEFGFPGVVWNGWLIPHLPIPGHAVFVHNDAGNVSHDYYPVQPSGSPGGGISPAGYHLDYEGWANFQGLNVPPRLAEYQSQYNPNLPVHTEIEDLVVVCPNFDYGDLHIDYPTIDIESCGPAHPLTNKAWLGDSIDSEIQPRIYNNDSFDDGVRFVGLPWMPGTQVQVAVTVTTGANFLGEDLFVNAWKDGNIDGDFDDGPNINPPPGQTPEDDSLQCSEWVIQDVQVPGAGIYNFQFCDPGVFDLGAYELRIRFRLTSQPVGRFGYGGYWAGGVSNGLGTYDIDWVLGEVEDYAMEEMQLAVELRSFHAIPGDAQVDLRWTTASESGNRHFTLTRSASGEAPQEIARISSRGNSTTDQSYAYRDAGLVNGRAYTYQLSATDLNGITEVLATETATPYSDVLPLDYALRQNHPNPFNANTEIEYALRENGHVVLAVYNAMGQRVATLVNAEQSANTYRVSFNAGELASGIYLYKLEVNGFTAVKKMALIR